MMFLSYSREDRAAARRMVSALADHGKDVARDPTLVQGDAFWRRTVRHRLAHCRSMVVLWSDYSARSPWVAQEIRHFRGEKLLVRLDDAELSEDLASEWTDMPSLRADPFSTHPSAQGDVGESAVLAARRACLLDEARRLTRLRREMRKPGLQAAARSEHEVFLEDGARLIRLPSPADLTGRSGSSTFLAATPVTNLQYARFLSDTGYPSPPTWTDERFRIAAAPVVGVTWFEACAYSIWAGVGLPTRDEWMRAASGADARVEFATADGRIADDTAHFGGEFATGAPTAVQAHPPNPAGFYGMCGNTWDWCSSREGPYRIVCGGGYMDASKFCRTDTTYRNSPIDRDCCVGFRIKLTTDDRQGG
jgi:formylglycine-generating enzyme required for sulfatase activity